MPIILDDLQSTPVVQSYDPKRFFSTKLTGRGGKSAGRLSAKNNPINIDANVQTDPTNAFVRRKEYKNKFTNTTQIPLNPIYPERYNDLMHTITMPELNDMVIVGKLNKDDIYMHITANAIILEETSAPANTLVGGQPVQTGSKIKVNYLLFFFTVRDTNDRTADNEKLSQNANKNSYLHFFSDNPLMDTTTDIYQYLTAMGCKLNGATIRDYISNFDLYTSVVKLSEIWQTTIHKTIDDLLSNAEKALNKSIVIPGQSENDILRNVYDEVRYIMSYNVPLDLYKNIYQSINKHFQPDVAKKICKQNLNLMLSDTMNSLNNNKANIASFTIPQNVTEPQSVQRLSPEQHNAVTSTEPLILVQAGAGTGKAETLDMPILTPHGWTTMGELEVGDLVIGSDGKPHKVLRIHEQGLKDGYELTFRDGSNVTVCKEHLWTIQMVDHHKTIEKTITTEEWLQPKYLNHAFLPIVKPVEYEFGEKELPLDPYFLGALLADGNFTNSSIRYTKSEELVFKETAKRAANNSFTMTESECDTYTARQWKFSHPDDTPNRSVLKHTLADLELLGCKSREKFIPEIYKTASVEQRKQLLNGLFDGDGDIRTGRTYARYNTASDQLAEDVLQLLWSLGLSATKQRQKHKKGDYWSINLLDGSWDPFIASEFKGKASGAVRPMRRSLVDYQPVYQVPMRCIEVDAPDKLYVTKDFIVTHNSTLILGRIDYLTACGVNPADITVLSFTNAAADHIKEKNPNVHSMTIASMIHEIYSANFGDHNLSSLDTIYNSIDIYFPTTPQSQMTNDIPHAFQRRILSIIKNDANAVTQMNNFIEENYDEVINILNTVKQTTLELEIIICYQKIGTFKEPSSVQSKFLIIDEVQDNSIFEFIYMLRYIEKHKESLFIVGDCSQTLYEFRASNPRALNILENSNTFATYQLNVNYRSNQEILDFANVALLGIEANQYARIQLQANSMAKVTEQSFLDRVFFNYHQLKNQKDFHEALDTIMVKEIKPYIDQCIARNEQVAFLSYTRRDISRIQEILERMYPTKQAVSLVPQKTSNMTLFSNYIKQFWSELKWAPTQDIVAMIVSEINNRLDRLIKYVKDPVAMASSILSRWIKESSATINMWSNMVTNGQLTHDKFLNLVKENMLQYEIRYNAIHQSLTSAKNQTNKNSDASKNATFLLSTIHSAKGLEFDNVVVCYKNKECNNEESKRMYYVAFTRAMKSEYILAYDTVASPQIEADYLTVLKKLHDIAPAANSPLDKPSKNMKIKI